jgi:hypothetical protein
MTEAAGEFAARYVRALVQDLTDPDVAAEVGEATKGIEGEQAGGRIAGLDH